MSLSRWKKIRLIHEVRNPWWSYRTEEFELPSGKRGQYHYAHTNGSSLTIPVFDDGTILMVRQYRYLCDSDSLEFPCGSVKDGHSFEETARSELTEEAGFSADSFEQVGEFNPYNGVTDETCRVYIARGLSVHQASPDETEEFELIRLSAAEIDSRIKSGEVWDGMSIAAWMLCRDRIQ